MFLSQKQKTNFNIIYELLFKLFRIIQTIQKL